MMMMMDRRDDDAQQQAAMARQQQQEERRRRQQQHQQVMVPWMKLIAVGILLGLVILLQLSVWTLEVYEHALRESLPPLRHRILKNQQQQSASVDTTAATSANGEAFSNSDADKTSQPSDDDDDDDDEEEQQRRRLRNRAATVKHSTATRRDSLHNNLLHSSYAGGQARPTAAATAWQAARNSPSMEWEDIMMDPVVLQQETAAAAAAAGAGGGMGTVSSSVGASSKTRGLFFGSTSSSGTESTASTTSSTSSTFSSSSSSSSSAVEAATATYGNATDTITWLQRAAASGHPTAQLLLANSLASGIWPVSVSKQALYKHQQYQQQHSVDDNDNARGSQYRWALAVQDEWVYTPASLTTTTITAQPSPKTATSSASYSSSQTPSTPSSSSSSQARKELLPSSESGENHNSPEQALSTDSQQQPTVTSSSRQKETTKNEDHQDPNRMMMQQQNEAWILWHMAAVGGSVEAAMTMAARLEHLQHVTPTGNSGSGSGGSAASSGGSAATKTNAAAAGALPLEAHVKGPQKAATGPTSTSGSIPSTSYSSAHISPKEWCQRRLPYWAAAAHGTMDVLEADTHSRAKIVPAKDKHVLYQVHLHGGTGSKLDMDNRPDESADALQFYHTRAVEAAATANAAKQQQLQQQQQQGGSGSGGSGSSSQAQQAVANAAMTSHTLARFYHYGLRGVAQNLTLALEYYEKAAQFEHWEAAGHAGFFHLYGIGTEQNAFLAHKFFRIGMPFNLEICRRRYQRKIKTSKDDSEVVYPCDPGCVNGMGLLHLFGVPMLVGVHTEDAADHFKLAKEQGHADAAYNLAMMKLGWKTHYRPLDQLEKDGQTQLKDEYFPMMTEKSSHPTVAEYQSILGDLTTAAGKGHLQAKHRLAMIYEQGMSVPVKGTQTVVVRQDCEKATKYYKTILDMASPHRSRRLRRAYKQYMAGDTARSLRNYIAAAEMGSEIGQVNAAFLLEHGECLGLDRIDCAKASVRLWKAAAARDNDEASLRVGDFYYYGRFRKGRHRRMVGPFGWFHYIIFPEELLTTLYEMVVNQVSSLYLHVTDKSDVEGAAHDMQDSSSQEGEAGGSTDDDDDEDDEEAEKSLEQDLATAAHYYRKAADLTASPRANYNLGFMYEWGLGLKQDFPLAKRHYDLAITGPSSEAEVPVSLALMAMHLHERLVKMWIAWSAWREEFTAAAVAAVSNGGGANPSSSNDSSNHENTPAVAESPSSRGGHPVPNNPKQQQQQQQPVVSMHQKLDVIVKHLLSWESLLILILTIVLSVLMRYRQRT